MTRTTSKIFQNSVPDWMYGPAYYPSYAVGSFYILPRAHLTCLLEGLSKVGLVSVEDVYVTGLLREFCQLSLVNVPHSSPGLLTECEVDQRTMVVQLVGDIQMDQVERWVKPGRQNDCQ